MMLEINCAGTPFQIGLEHGSKAARQIRSTIDFYSHLFQQKCGLEWEGACAVALKYAPHVQRHYPWLDVEMHGIADGAGVTYEEILALNVRTELMFGLFSDGCTSLSWKTDGASLVAQNWDWMVEQKSNLVVLNIQQSGKPTINMITESGMIGKIGLNSAALGLCINAIKCAGTDYNRTPVHLCWRLVLECTSISAAATAISAHGCAAAAHMLVVDRTTSLSFEVTHRTIRRLHPDDTGRIFHSNHMLLSHPGTETRWSNDSWRRVKRIRQLADAVSGTPDQDTLLGLMSDEEGYPCSINRAQVGESETASVFSISMDLVKVEAKVLLGRPSQPDGSFMLFPRKGVLTPVIEGGLDG